MQLSRLFLPLLLAGSLLLAFSNPSDKGQFVVFMSRKATNLMCESPSARRCENLCTVARPATFQATRGIFSLYTQKPKNYLLFTTFRSDLPGLEVRAVGIANTYLLAPVDVDALRFCELTGELFDQGRQSLRRHWQDLRLEEEVICL